MPTSSITQQHPPYDDTAAAAAAAAVAAAVDMTTNGGGGLMENDLIMMAQPNASGGKRQHDEVIDATTATKNDDDDPMLLVPDADEELLTPAAIHPAVAVAPSAAGFLPPPSQQQPNAMTTTNTNNTTAAAAAAPPLSLTIRPSPEGIPDKPKSKRINWGKSPHKERLSQILNDWFNKSGQCLEEHTGMPIQDYRVYATKVGISRTTLFKYIHKDPSKRRLLRDDTSSGSRGKKRLISEEEVKSIVKELKEGLKDDSTPPSRIEAVDLIMKRFDLNRQAASRQLTRHVLPMFHNEGIFLVGGDNDDEEEDENGGNNTQDDGERRKVAPPPPAASQQQQQQAAAEVDGGVSTIMETFEGNPIHQSKQRRSIVISGVTSGLGRALLGYFYNHGHSVAGCGRRVSEIQALQVQFPNARLSVVDVSDDKSVQLWANTICGGGVKNDDDGEESNEIDLVIANAGVSPETMHQTKSAWEVPREDFDETIDVNIKGVSNMIRHFVPHMIKNNAGTFVAMSSGLGRSPNPYHAAYCASKWAIEGMIKSLAMSLPDGMCAVPLAPGVVQTGMQPGGKNEGSSSSASSSGNIDKWIEAAAPMILGLSRKDNGKSLSVKGFYSVRYRQSWSFPDGSGIPDRVGHVF